MSLTPAEKNSIKRYLGLDLITADAWRGSGAAGLDRNLERLDADALVTVRALLTELAAVDASIPAARGRLKASEVGNITLNPAELTKLRRERSALAAELAALLGVTPRESSGRIIV